MAGLDYYETLGVLREATDEEIKQAYRKLVFQYHPDRNPNNKAAEAKIREVNAAYEVIGDPENRKSYERLRFGAYELREAPPDPAVILEEMENKLYDEGRKEVFAVLVQDVKRIKVELALVRERTVAQQGYDAFKDGIVTARAAQVMHELVTPEMESRKKRLLDVALQMMVSQRVVEKDEVERVQDVKERLRESFQRGRLYGFRDALELFYARR